MQQDSKLIPQQPYFLRALYEWCVDSGHTPYLNVRVDEHCTVPRAYVKDGQIVLNIGPSAVRGLAIDNDWVSFSARFGGVSQDISIPVGNVLAIYASETGEGMAFTQTSQAPVAQVSDQDEERGEAAEVPDLDPDRPKGRARLRVVK